MNIFTRPNYTELAKEARFKPHPVLTIVLFTLVFFGSQILAGIPIAVSMAALGTFVKDASGNFIMEMSPENQVWYTIIQLFATIIPMAVAILFCCLAERRSLRSMGFVREGWLKKYLLGMAMGFAMFSAALGISVLAGGAQFVGTDMYSPLQYVLLCVGWLIQGAEEEIMLRGYFMPSLSARLPMWAAVLISSLFFSLMHLFNTGFTLMSFLNILLIGIAFGLVAIRTNSLFTCCALHSVWNWAQGNFYGLPVSGMETGPSVLRFSLTDSPLWSGGAFGIEGSMPALIVELIVIALLLFIPQKKKPAAAE